MARPLRLQYKNAYYHVMNRGRNKACVFQGQEDYQDFLRLIAEACERFNVTTLAYCLMSNHYHFLIQTPDANLARFMRHVDGVYTQKHNRKYKKDGSLFRGRYKSILVEEEVYLLRLIRYIHLNPVKAKLNLDYPWSSNQNYLKAQDIGGWLKATQSLAFISKNKSEAITEYRNFIEAGIDEGTQAFYSKKSLSPIFGSEKFLEKVKTMIKGSPKETIDVPQKRSMQSAESLAIIMDSVPKYSKVSKYDILISKKGVMNLPRLFAISLSVEMSGLTHKQIAKEFNLSHERSVSAVKIRFDQLRKENKQWNKRYNELKSIIYSQVET